MNFSLILTLGLKESCTIEDANLISLLVVDSILYCRLTDNESNRCSPVFEDAFFHLRDVTN